MYLFLAVLRLCYCSGFSVVSASGGYSHHPHHNEDSVLQCTESSLWWLLLLGTTGSRVWGFTSCGLLVAGSLVAAPRLQSTGRQLWCTGLVAPQHVGSSRTRDRTRVSCIGRWILYHRATRKTLDFQIISYFLIF